MRRLLLFIVLLLPAQKISAHSRWKCPEARSPSTSIKSGPCGDDTNNFGNDEEPIVEIQPGPLRVIFEESIHHTGAPFRISLSGERSDDLEDTCVLLDHIPHNDNVSPGPWYTDPTTYTPYVITIDIPDVYCERCSLHLSNPMTDKIGSKGSPTGIGCTDPNGSCFSVYHSCTKPLRIVGTLPRSEYKCMDSSLVGPDDWPRQWTGDGGQVVEASVPGVYRRESSVWSSNDYTLETAPLRYRLDAGGVCGKKDVDEGDIIAGANPAITTADTAQPTPSQTDAPTMAPVVTENTDIQHGNAVNDESYDADTARGTSSSSPASSPETSAAGLGLAGLHKQPLILLAVSVAFLFCIQ